MVMYKGFMLFSLPDTEPCTPQYLKKVHPLLCADAAALSPWEPSTSPAGLAGGMVWRSACAAPAPILMCGECSSSLDVAWEVTRAWKLAPWSSVLATTQNQGRGQLRRFWQSPPGNVYAAMLLPPDFLKFKELASIAAGVCLARALRETGLEIWLKWPNDMLLADKKVGGILLEERGGQLMAGVGINLAQAPDAAMLQRASSAPEAGCLAGENAVRSIGPLRLWAKMVQGIREAFWAIDNAGRDSLLNSIEEILAWKGRQVRVREPGCCGAQGTDFDKPGGQVVGITVDGALRLVRNGGEIHVRSGSIVLATH